MRIEPTCCKFCGKDTKARSGICGRCQSIPRFRPCDESQGRKSRSAQLLGGMPDMHEETEPEEDTCASRFHGDSMRDDL
jgi:hypothetical protein